MNAKRIIVIIVGCFVVLGIMGYLLNVYFDSENQKTLLQHKMKSYLETTYVRDFTVGKPFITGNEGFGYNMWVAEVYPTDEPDLKFHIAWGKNDSSPYQDSYLVTRRSAQGKAEISKYLNEVYGQEVYIQYDLSTNIPELEKLDHNELLTKHGENVRFHLKYYVFVDKFDKQVEAEKAFKVLNSYVYSNRLDHYFFVVNYLSNDYKTEFDKGILQNPQRFFAMYNSDNLYKKHKLLNVLNVKSFKDGPTTPNKKSAEEINFNY
ncbi:MAG: hypothetical protein ABFD18_14825 [Syntrophomonas sp.]